jgi:DnaJ domain
MATTGPIDTDMNPYHLLGITTDCTRAEVRKAFLLKAQHAHPDHGGEDPSFVQFRAAYEQILRELDRRPGLAAQTPDQTLRNNQAQTRRDSRVERASYIDIVKRLSVRSARNSNEAPRWLTLIAIIVFLWFIVAAIWANWYAWTWDPVEEAARQADRARR